MNKLSSKAVEISGDYSYYLLLIILFVCKRSWFVHCWNLLWMIGTFCK